MRQLGVRFSRTFRTFLGQTQVKTDQIENCADGIGIESAVLNRFFDASEEIVAPLTDGRTDIVYHTSSFYIRHSFDFISTIHPFQTISVTVKTSQTSRV